MTRWISRTAGVVLAGAMTPGAAETSLDPAVADLALLAACDHSILSQGLYGQWAAFLAGGDAYTRYGPLTSDIMVKN